MSNQLSVPLRAGGGGTFTTRFGLGNNCTPWTWALLLLSTARAAEMFVRYIIKSQIFPFYRSDWSRVPLRLPVTDVISFCNKVSTNKQSRLGRSSVLSLFFICSYIFKFSFQRLKVSPSLAVTKTFRKMLLTVWLMVILRGLIPSEYLLLVPDSSPILLFILGNRGDTETV